MLQFEQGGLDSLWEARRAIDRAIEVYDAAQRGVPLTAEEGPLFGALDNLDTVEWAVKCFRNTATKE